MSTLHFERLEPRRLLAVVDPFAATINFQPEGLGPVEFTNADFGRPFALRGNGLRYGWNRNLEADGDILDRDSNRELPGLTVGGRIGNGPEGESQDVDERFDTFAQVRPGDEWSIEVPNGTFAVALVSGDPSFQGAQGDRVHVWDVNGQPVMRAQPISDYPWGEALAFVVVTDNRIRLTAGEESVGSSLSFVRVAHIEDRPQPPQGRRISWRVSAEEELIAPARRAEGGTVRLGDKLYVIAGFGEGYTTVQRTVDILDLSTFEWSIGTPLPEGAPETHAGFAADQSRGHIYWISGQIGTGESGQSRQTTPAVYRYVTGDGRWERFVDLPEPRFGGAAAVVGDTLYFFGGDDTSRVIARGDSWKIDLSAPTTDSNGDGVPEGPAWQAIATMPIPGDHLNAEVLGGKIYITGGEYGHGVSYVQRAELQIYDIAGDAWSLGAPLPTPSSHIRSIAHAGRLWLFGGQKDAQIVIDEVRSYDPGRDAWELHDPMPQPRKVGYVFERESTFYYVGGDAYTSGFLRSVLIGELEAEDEDD